MSILLDLIIPSGVLGIVIIAILKQVLRNKSRRKTSNKSKISKKANSYIKNYDASYSTAGKLKVPKDLFFEDRDNDWLAKQMKEESKIKNSTMTDLGAMHDKNCEAREIKVAHEKAHSKYNYKRGKL